MRGGVALLATALVACGGAPTQRDAPAAPAAAPTTTPAAPAPASGRLTGKVSGLRANVSGLASRETDTALILTLAADTLFAFDRADLTPEASANLGKVADAIRAGGAGDVAITGYTDAKGEPAYNQALSERRARSVADWMAGQAGVRLRRFIVTGRGEADPVAPNAGADGSDSPQGRARNRRVEISIPK